MGYRKEYIQVKVNCRIVQRFDFQRPIDEIIELLKDLQISQKAHVEYMYESREEVYIRELYILNPNLEVMDVIYPYGNCQNNKTR